jgi:hypothetical protein
LLQTEFEAETHVDPGIYDHCVECHFGKVTSRFGFGLAPLSADLFLGWCTAHVNAGGETPWLSATPVKLAVSKRSTAQAASSGASGHLYPRIARAKATTAGEKRLPAIDTRET